MAGWDIGNPKVVNVRRPVCRIVLRAYEAIHYMKTEITVTVRLMVGVIVHAVAMAAAAAAVEAHLQVENAALCALEFAHFEAPVGAGLVVEVCAVAAFRAFGDSVAAGAAVGGVVHAVSVTGEVAFVEA